MELYIHIPFCKKKCKYCDFLSWDNCEDKINPYVDALIQDIRYSLLGLETGRADSTIISDKNYKLKTLSSVYIGGGTPGLIPAYHIERIMDTVKKFSNINEDTEITIELNPCTVTEEKVRCYKNTGINRVSMGVQSFNNKELELLGRAHNEEDVYKAFSILQKAGFENINLDLIHGLPGQDVAVFLDSLDKAINLGPKHISAYELIIEPGTVLYEQYGPGSGYVPKENVQADIYCETIKRLDEAGYFQYEISNFSKPGYESKHNCGYWTGEPYLGCGAGAVGYAGNLRTTKIKNINEYIANPHAVTTEVISMEEKKQEFVFLGMRMSRGITYEDYENKFGEIFPDSYKKIFDRFVPDFINKTDKGYSFTTQGFLVSNIILSEFV
ncbi:MAG: radical SAM family heme chaperone HemW [Lachnospiraceae bacterium]